jgi:acetyl esterase/lipase
VIQYYHAAHCFSGIINEEIIVMQPPDSAKTSMQTAYARSRLSYGPQKLQFADLYQPSTQGPHPVVILLHGGFWRSAYGLDLMHPLAENLAAQGIAAYNVEYRRVGDSGGGWPGTLQDVAAATDYLRTIAPQYQLDLDHVLPVGHSAGGHLALWLAARHKLPLTGPLSTEQTSLSLLAAISLAGAMDLEQVWQQHLGNDAVAELLGGTPQQVPERYQTASPAALLPLGLPQVLVHGTRDDRVPLNISQGYAHKATAAGDTIELIELPGTDHFVLIDPHSAAWQQTLTSIHRFLHTR